MDKNEGVASALHVLPLRCTEFGDLNIGLDVIGWKVQLNFAYTDLAIRVFIKI